MKKVLYILPILILGMVSCQDFFDEKQLGNENYTPSDIRTGMTYTLTDDDYKTIATNATNVEKALAIDSAAYLELQDLANTKAFTETLTADVYVPAFMASKFPYLDNGTMCEVSYRNFEGKTMNAKAFASTSAYTLTAKDYEAIWNKRGAAYLTPNSLEKVPDFLKTKFPTAVTNKMIVLTYNYNENEPNAEDLSDFLPYALTLSQFMVMPDDEEHEFTGTVGTVKSTIYGRFYMIDGDTSVYVYGLTDENGNKVWKDKGIQTGDQITVRAKYSTAADEPQLINAVYVSHTPAASLAPANRKKTVAQQTETYSLYQLAANGEWEVYANEDIKALDLLPQNVYDATGLTQIKDMTIIETYLRKTYPYAQTDEVFVVIYNGANGMTADEWIYDGENFIITSEYTQETMTFEVKNDAWVANISTYLQQPFVGDGQGKFTIQHVDLDGLSYIWRYQAAYGMTASSYVSGTNHAVDDWLISPTIRLKKSIQPQMTFEHAVRYGNTTNNPQWLNVMVTNNFTGDVTTTEWKHLEFPEELPDGSNWIFRSAGVFDLSEYNGQNIVVAFRYHTFFEGEATSCPTWEIKNLLIAEPEEATEE